MNTKEIAQTLVNIPGVQYAETIEYVIPDMPASVEATLPDNYAVMVTPKDAGYEVQFENRPSIQYQWDDTDFYGDPTIYGSMDAVVSVVKAFIACH